MPTRVLLTPENVFDYIGYDAYFRTGKEPGRQWATTKILGVADSGWSIRVDYPALHDCLEIRGRKVYAIVPDEEYYS